LCASYLHLHAVDSTLSKYNKVDRTIKSTPLDITIVTTDVALFSDTSAEAHKTAVEKFVEHVTPAFQKSAIGSVQIVVAKMTVLGLQLSSSTKKSDEDDKKDDDGDVVMRRTEAMGASSDEAKNHKCKMSQCVNIIRTTLEDLEFASNAQKGATAGTESTATVSVSLDVVNDSPVDFKLLSRRWVNKALPTLQRPGKLTFNLPEGTDGTQCSVAFDASYQLLPFSITSTQTSMMLSDLADLSKLNLQVAQLVPIASLDASLLFGIPMLLRARFEKDVDQFQQMNILVRSLFRWLQDREQAILLRAPSGKNSICHEAKKGLFASATEHLFVLMAQEVPSAGQLSPSTGLLYRIAHADHRLATDVSTDPDFGKSTIQQETASMYAEYIEAALNGVECGPFNPLDLDAIDVEAFDRQKHDATTDTQHDTVEAFDATDSATHITPMKSLFEDMDGPETSVFDDSAGVGATVCKETTTTTKSDKVMDIDHGSLLPQENALHPWTQDFEEKNAFDGQPISPKATQASLQGDIRGFFDDDEEM
jgi:hypothetical protein